MRAIQLQLSASSLVDAIDYQFLDSDGVPIDLGERSVGVSVCQLEPIETATFYHGSPVCQKIDSRLGIVRINFTADPINHTLPPIISTPGHYRLVVWAYFTNNIEQTPALYDVGLYDSARYDDDMGVLG